MKYKQFNILLLLQVFLFIQCSTAETSDSTEKKQHNDFVNTSQMTDLNTSSSDSNKDKAIKTKNNNIEGLKQNNFKRVEFGFNIGYLNDLQDANLYERALSQIKQDGITDLRIYEPFTKNIVQNPGLADKLLSPLTGNGFKILLCLSNYPNISSLHYNKAMNNPEQNNMMRFTNRRAPDNIDAYQSYLTNFLDNFQSKNLLQDMSFEIGNEPDAKKYFWGQTEDFIKIAKAIKQSLAKYNKPIYCCGFTSNFANQGSSKNVDYYNFLNDNSFFDNVNLSFHFYKNQINDITKIHLPRLNNSIITEFNLFTSLTQKSDSKNDIVNSPEFGSVLIKALVFAYRNNVKKIYLFRLADTKDKQTTYGFFDNNGNAKPCYKYFTQIYNVIKDGYNIGVTSNYINIVGKEETILYAIRNKISIPQKQIVASSKENNIKNLNNDEWVIFKN